MSKTCVVDGCDRPSKTRGMCGKHYQRWLKNTPRNERPSTEEDLSGMKFGRLSVISRAGQTRHHNFTWLCRCDCSNEVVVPAGHLKSGHTRSCGCLATELKKKRATRHGLLADGKRPRTFNIWCSMKMRCLNPNAINYHSYGGRGIGICEEWMTFENFHRWAMANGYADDLEIDRIDNDGDYCPENCRWVTREQNQRNTSRTHLITLNGKTQCATDWIRELGISKSTFYVHLKDGTLDKFLGGAA